MAGDTTYQVVFLMPRGEVSVPVRDDEFILAAARRQGLELPSLCEQGWCITCAVELLEGEVDQSASRRFYQDDREAGFALICTGMPRSNLRLRPGATEKMRAFRISRRLPVPRGTGLRGAVRGNLSPYASPSKGGELERE